MRRPRIECPIGMLDQPGRRALASDGHVACFEGDRGMQRLAHAPAHDLAGMHVDQRCEEQSQPSPVRIQVRSASHTWFGAVAVKVRRSLFGSREDQKTVRRARKDASSAFPRRTGTVFPRGG